MKEEKSNSPVVKGGVKNTRPKTLPLSHSQVLATIPISLSLVKIESPLCRILVRDNVFAPCFSGSHQEGEPKLRKTCMPLSVLPCTYSPTDSEICQTPWWGAWSAILILGCFYLTQAVGMLGTEFIAGIGVGFVDSSLGDREGALAKESVSWLVPCSFLVGTVLAGVVTLKFADRRAKPSLNADWFWDLMGQSYDLRNLGWFITLGLSLGLGFFALTEYGVLPPDDLPQPIFDALLAAPLLLQIGWVLMIVVLFPLMEETLFRGLLFTGLAQSWGTTIGGIMTTVLFVAVHMPKVLEYWPALLAVSLIGTLAVWLRIHTGSLAPGIAMHSTYNGVLVAVGFLTQPSL